MTHRSDLQLMSYVELKVAWKCRPGTLSDSQFGSEQPNEATRLHVVGFEKCVWKIPIWEHYHDWHDGGFYRVDPPMRELHWRKLRKPLVYETDAQWTHGAIKMWWIGPTRGNGMMGDQRSPQIINLTFGCWVMSSWKSHENGVHATLATVHRPWKTLCRVARGALPI